MALERRARSYCPKRYHFEGHLHIVNRNDFRELFLLASDIIRAADGKLVILQIPLLRYLLVPIQDTL
jgi:hypothetical protein